MLVDSDKIVAAAKDVVAGIAPVPWHWRYPGIAAATPQTQPIAPADASSQATATQPAEAAAGAGEPITMPFGDLTISEGKILRWVKAEGDSVEPGELVAEIETDKAVVEIEAPAAGRLKIELPQDTVVPMGGRIGAVL